eukprot:1515810-Amphidinium_carterae.1
MGGQHPGPGEGSIQNANISIASTSSRSLSANLGIINYLDREHLMYPHTSAHAPKAYHQNL